MDPETGLSNLWFIKNSYLRYLHKYREFQRNRCSQSIVQILSYKSSLYVQLGLSVFKKLSLNRVFRRLQNVQPCPEIYTKNKKSSMYSRVKPPRRTPSVLSLIAPRPRPRPRPVARPGWVDIPVLIFLFCLNNECKVSERADRHGPHVKCRCQWLLKIWTRHSLSRSWTS